MTRYLRPGYEPQRHRHRDDYTPRGVAGWFGCPGCQKGRPIVLTAAAATAISTILTSLRKG